MVIEDDIILILQSKSSFGTTLKLNPDNGEYSVINLKADLNENLPPNINGVFDFLNGVLVALYALSGTLILRVGNEVVPLLEGVNVEVTGGPSNRLITVKRHGDVITSMCYDISETFKFQDDTTPFIEDEDFDFGLFLSNVISNPTRMKILLEYWYGCSERIK